MFPSPYLRAFVLGCGAAMALPAWAEPIEVGSQSCCEKPPIRVIDKTCLPAGSSPKVVPLFRADVNAKYQQIAYIDSFVALDNCSDTVQKQLKDLQAKARQTGADALVRVRLLKNRVRGFKEDPYTAFFSVTPGASDDYFFRATAIKYLERVPEEPETVPIVVANQMDRRRERDALSTNRLLGTDSRRRFERVPNVIEAPITTTPGVFR